MGKKAKAPTQQQTTTSTPWEEQIPYLQDLFQGARKAKDANMQNQFPEQTVAPVDPATTNAQNEILTNIMPYLSQLAGQGRDATQFGLSDVLDVDNPVTQGAITAATRPIQETLTESVLPQISSNAVLSGNLGSSRQGIAEGLASGRASRAIGDTAASVANTTHGQALNTFLGTLGLLPQTMQAQLSPAIAGDAVGQQRQQHEQQLVDEQVSKQLFEQNRDDNALATYASLISPPQGGTTTGVGTGSAPQSNKFGGAIGGAMSGFQLSGGSPWGAAAGGILGFLGG